MPVCIYVCVCKHVYNKKAQNAALQVVVCAKRPHVRNYDSAMVELRPFAWYTYTSCPLGSHEPLLHCEPPIISCVFFLVGNKQTFGTFGSSGVWEKIAHQQYSSAITSNKQQYGWSHSAWEIFSFRLLIQNTCQQICVCIQHQGAWLSKATVWFSKKTGVWLLKETASNIKVHDFLKNPQRNTSHTSLGQERRSWAFTHLYMFRIE